MAGAAGWAHCLGGDGGMSDDLLAGPSTGGEAGCDEVQAVSGQLSSLCLDPPSFR